MSWLYLIAAGFTEIFFATFLKLSDQFTKFWPSAGCFIFGAISVYLMSKAMKDIPVAVVYAIWTGIGIAGVAAIEIIFFDAQLTLFKISLIGIILMCIIGLKIA